MWLSITCPASTVFQNWIEAPSHFGEALMHVWNSARIWLWTHFVLMKWFKMKTTTFGLFPSWGAFIVLIWPFHFGESVSFLLKSEPIEIKQKLNLLVEGRVVWKFLKTPRVSGSTSVRNGIQSKIYGDHFVLKKHNFPVEDRPFMLWINENIFQFVFFRRKSQEILNFAL